MDARSSAAVEAARELTLTRLFDAPRALVFKAWTMPEHLARWWGPHGFTVFECQMDLRVGGGWYIRMGSAPDKMARQRGIIREIIPPARLVFTYAFEDEAGTRGHETIVTVTFAEEAGKTRLTVHQEIFDSDFTCKDHVRGWSQALERFTDYLNLAKE